MISFLGVDETSLKEKQVVPVLQKEWFPKVPVLWGGEESPSFVD